jgi:hypothetical protein
MKNCKPEYDFTNMVILAQCIYFMDKDKEYIDRLAGSKFDWILKYRSFARLYLKSRTIEESKKETLEKIDTDPVFQMAKKQENISYIVFVLELTSIWIKSYPQNKLPTFSVSKKKLRHGAKWLSIDMLKLKQYDKELYKDKKLIIEGSKEAARQVWSTINRHLLCAEHPYIEN